MAPAFLPQASTLCHLTATRLPAMTQMAEAGTAGMAGMAGMEAAVGSQLPGEDGASPIHKCLAQHCKCLAQHCTHPKTVGRLPRPKDHHANHHCFCHHPSSWARSAGRLQKLGASGVRTWPTPSCQCFCMSACSTCRLARWAGRCCASMNRAPGCILPQ